MPRLNLTDHRLKLTPYLAIAFFAPFIMLASGCSTSKDELLPHGGSTMMDVWDQGASGSSNSTGSRQLLDARQDLRRPLMAGDKTSIEANGAFTRTAQNEIYSQFKRLPNPDLVMYVFPHLAGSDPAPIPGYTTVFPLAMPGERTEAY